MAEDLTDYLHEHGVRVRYLHADIETVERTEIIRDLRLGKFDVLVGINLLREGLDMPEVSLVAILDADKEGFLRSDNSLIQTIGRAARNVQRPRHPLRRPGHRLDAAGDGRDRAAPRTSSSSTTSRTASRPEASSKAVPDIMEGARSSAPRPPASGAASGRARPQAPARLWPGGHGRRDQGLEKRMYRQARRNLEFEEAAALRDQIETLKALELDLGATRGRVSAGGVSSRPEARSSLDQSALSFGIFRGPFRFASARLRRRVAQW